MFVPMFYDWTTESRGPLRRLWRAIRRQLRVAVLLACCPVPAFAVDLDSLLPVLPTLKAQAEQGDAPAQFALGLRYERGDGVPQDEKEAAAWYRKAADQGDPRAQFNLGLLYQDGRGVPQDDHEAAAWYRKAADQGAPFAQFNLGLLYKDGRGVPQNVEEAYFWLLLGASAGDNDAVALRDQVAGRLTPAQVAAVQQRAYAWRPTPTLPPALKALKAQAEHGDAVAQLSLGRRHERGDGVPQDEKEAAAWYRKAADQGLALAQSILGHLYEDGDGVPQDYHEAAAWYRKAAEQGDPRAQTALGLLYASGRGVPKNAEEAYFWLLLGTNAGNATADELSYQVASRLTPAQVAAVRQRVRDWKPTPASHATPP